MRSEDIHGVDEISRWNELLALSIAYMYITKSKWASTSVRYTIFRPRKRRGRHDENLVFGVDLNTWAMCSRYKMLTLNGLRVYCFFFFFFPYKIFHIQYERCMRQPICFRST